MTKEVTVNDVKDWLKKCYDKDRQILCLIAISDAKNSLQSLQYHHEIEPIFLAKEVESIEERLGYETLESLTQAEQSFLKIVPYMNEPVGAVLAENAADKLANYFRNNSLKYSINPTCEALTSQALQQMFDELKSTNEQDFSIKQIKISENFQTSVIPSALSELANLERITVTNNCHLKWLCTSAKNSVKAVGCEDLEGIEARKAEKGIMCDGCKNLSCIFADNARIISFDRKINEDKSIAIRTVVAPRGCQIFATPEASYWHSHSKPATHEVMQTQAGCIRDKLHISCNVM